MVYLTVWKKRVEKKREVHDENAPSANFGRNTERSHLLTEKRCNETSFSWCPIRTKWRFVEINQ